MRVFCNGFNLYGQLGSERKHLLENFLETNFNNQKTIKDIIVNQTYSIVQFEDNEIVFNGANDCRKLPFKNVMQISSNNDRLLVLSKGNKINKIDISDLDNVTQIPNFVEEKYEYNIEKVALGDKLTVFYTNTGKLYNFPNKLNFVSQQVVDIKTGREHCVILDLNGNVYTFGRGSRGQLGHGTLDDEEEPLLVEALAGVKIVEIAAGGWHSCAISDQGDLYTWGWNSNGQLGLFDDEKSSLTVMAVPQVVDFEKTTKNVQKTACGNRHTIALLEDNTLQGCGWNKYKQLLNTNQENFYKFTNLEKFNGKIRRIKCGPWNSIVFCEQ